MNELAKTTFDPVSDKVTPFTGRHFNSSKYDPGATIIAAKLSNCVANFKFWIVLV